MLFRIAIKHVLHGRGKYIGAGLGVGCSGFLILALISFYLGFSRDITTIPDALDCDLWITQKNVVGVDFPVFFDDLNHWVAQGHPGIQSSTRVLVGFALWRSPRTGAMENAQVLGFEPDSGIKLALGADNHDMATLLRGHGHVIVDLKDLRGLGIARKGDFGAEVSGHVAAPVGFSRNLRLFNASYLVIADLDNARAFLGSPASGTSFIALKCRPGFAPAAVARELQEIMPDQEVLSAQEFHDRTQRYWKERTGIGAMIFMSAALAAVIGFLTVFLTFYLMTMQKIPVYAAMKALGAASWEIALIVGIEVGCVFILGTSIAVAIFLLSQIAFAQTTISVVMTTPVAAAALGGLALASVTACVPSILRISKLEPAEAFRV